MPRFAARGYIPSEADGSHLGFLNVRRLDVLVNHVRTRFQPTEDEEGPGKELSENLDAIGDSLIKPPLTLLERYWILLCDLSKEYAEECFLSVPFIQAIDVGGGLCAQGAAWMASVFLHDLLDGLHGLAEITAIANRVTGDSDSNFSLSGLSFQQLRHYFEEIGASATTHCIDLQNRPGADLTPERELDSLQRSYLLSGFPSILSVDLGRMHGVAGTDSVIRAGIEGDSRKNKSIYVRNRMPEHALPSSLGGAKLRTQHHAVVSVAYEKDGADGSRKILFNDPSIYPLLEISFEDLLLRRNYRDLESDDNFVSEDGSSCPLVDAMLAAQFRFMPILPKAVNLFLGNTLPSNEPDGKQLGLFTLLNLIADQGELTGLSGRPWAQELLADSVQNGQMGEIRLVNVQDLHSKSRSPRTEQAIASLSVAIPDTLLDGLDSLSWVYIQYLTSDGESQSEAGLWLVWDATMSIAKQLGDNPYSMSADDGWDLRRLRDGLLLRAIAVEADGGIWVCDSAPASCEDRPDHQPPRRDSTEASQPCDCLWESIEPSIISSCFPTNPLPALGRVRAELVAMGILSEERKLPIELYTAMHSELLPSVKKFERGVVDDGSLEMLASMRGNSDLLSDWLTNLRSALEEHQLEVCGLASFVPEVTADDGQLSRKLAVDALCVMQRVAHLLREPEDPAVTSHPAKFIEVVGGSIVEGVFRNDFQEGPRRDFGVDLKDHRAVTIARHEAIDRLATALREATELATQEWAIRPTAFLVELEPGPLFTVNSSNSYLEL
ncbi:MAG: hypothetical protein AAGD07_22545, partial [Planctomycetota bacterium]